MAITLIDYVPDHILCRAPGFKPWRDLPFEGSVGVGETGDLEYKIINADTSATVVDWADLESVVWTGTDYTANAPRVPVGKLSTGQIWYHRQVRRKAVPADTDQSVNRCAIGSVGYISGQSNSVNLYYTSPLQGATVPDGVKGFKVHNDPGAFGVDVYRWYDGANNTITRGLTHLANTLDMPVGFFGCGNNGAPITAFHPLSTTWTGLIGPGMSAHASATNPSALVTDGSIGDVEWCWFHQGESGGDSYLSERYSEYGCKRWWEYIKAHHEEACRIGGRHPSELIMLLGNLLAYADYDGYTPYPTGPMYGYFAQALQRDGIRHCENEYPYINYSHSGVGNEMATNDIHHTRNGQEAQGERYAWSLTSMLGLTQGRPNIEMVRTEIVSATVTDVHLKHCGPSTDIVAGPFNNFEVMASAGGVPITPTTALRQGPTTIRLTHSTLNTEERYVRYGWIGGGSAINCVKGTDATESQMDTTQYVTGMKCDSLYFNATPIMGEAKRTENSAGSTNQPGPWYTTFNLRERCIGDRVLVFLFHSGTQANTWSLKVGPERYPYPLTLSSFTPDDTGIEIGVATVPGHYREIYLEHTSTLNGGGLEVNLVYIPANELASTTPTFTTLATSSNGTAATTIASPGQGVVIGAVGGNVRNLDMYNCFTGSDDEYQVCWAIDDLVSRQHAAFFGTRVPAGTRDLSFTSLDGLTLSLRAVVFQGKNELQSAMPEVGHNGRPFNINLWPYGDTGCAFANIIDGAFWIRNNTVGDVAFSDGVDKCGWPKVGNLIQYEIVGMHLPSERPGDWCMEWKGNGRVRVGQAVWDTRNPCTPTTVSTTVSDTSTAIEAQFEGVDGFARWSIDDTGSVEANAWNVWITNLDAANPIHDVKVYHIDNQERVRSGKRASIHFVQMMEEMGGGVFRTMDLKQTNSPMATRARHLKPEYYSTKTWQMVNDDIYAVTTNSGDAYAATIVEFDEDGSPLDRAVVHVKFNVTASDMSATTLNVNGTGAYPMKQPHPWNGTVEPYGAVIQNYRGFFVFDEAHQCYIGQQLEGVNVGIQDEIVVDLCNEMGMHAWTPIHHWACGPFYETDLVGATIARYRKGLRHGLKFITQVGNEIFNPQFIARKYYVSLRDVLYAGEVSGNAINYPYSRALSILGRGIGRMYSNDKSLFYLAGDGVIDVGRTATAAGTLAFMNAIFPSLQNAEGRDYERYGYEPADTWTNAWTFANYYAGNRFVMFGGDFTGEDYYDQECVDFTNQWLALMDAQDTVGLQALYDTWADRPAALDQDEPGSMAWYVKVGWEPVAAWCTQEGITPVLYEGGRHGKEVSFERVATRIVSISKAAQAVCTASPTTNRFLPTVGTYVTFEDSSNYGMSQLRRGADERGYKVTARDLNARTFTIDVNSTAFDDFVNPNGDTGIAVFHDGNVDILSIEYDADLPLITIDTDGFMPSGNIDPQIGSRVRPYNTGIPSIEGSSAGAFDLDYTARTFRLRDRSTDNQPAYTSGGWLWSHGVGDAFEHFQQAAFASSTDHYEIWMYFFTRLSELGILYPTQYALRSSTLFGVTNGSPYAAKQPIYQAYVDFNDGTRWPLTPEAPNIISLTAIPSSGTAPLTVSFLISATGNPAPTYVVTENGVTVHNSTSTSFSRVALAADTYVYNITATNSEGSDTLNSAATVTVSVGGGGGTPISVKTGDPLLVGGLPILSNGKRIWV